MSNHYYDAESSEVWKENIMSSLLKYDANSVEEVYYLGIRKGKKDALKTFINDLKEDVISRDKSYAKILDERDATIFNLATKSFLEAIDTLSSYVRYKEENIDE